MGTYTTNYNLFLPTIGEQGWGELVNGNFTTIDNTMSGLNTRLTVVENEVNGALSCTSVTTSGKVTANGGIGTTSLTTSGTITSTGKITANGGLAVTGGITSNLTGNVTGNLTGIITRTATVVTSAPYGYNNITLRSLSSFNSVGKTVTISAIPATATTPWGTYTMTRPSFTITYTATYRKNTGNEVVTITHNGTQVLSQTFTSDNKTKTFSITYNTAATSTLVCTSSDNGGDVTINPDITAFYLKYT